LEQLNRILPLCSNTSVVLATSWKAATGEIAIAVANHGTAAITVQLALQLPPNYGARSNLAVVPLVRPQTPEDGLDDDGNTAVVTDNVARVVKSLPGRSANVLELKPHL
jgi:hypothetical protein